MHKKQRYVIWLILILVIILALSGRRLLNHGRFFLESGNPKGQQSDESSLLDIDARTEADRIETELDSASEQEEGASEILIEGVSAADRDQGGDLLADSDQVENKLLNQSEVTGRVKAETGNVTADQATINYAVPFTAQAPLGRWDDDRQQDGCEEAAALMAMAWVRGEAGNSPAVWEEKIIALADWQQEKYGEHRDVAVADMRDRIFFDYFSHSAVAVKDLLTWLDILSELEQGHLVLMPTDGRALGNPHYKAPGPEHHMLLIKGYDYERREFITNDPGTRFGADYRYGYQTIWAAARAYPTGYKGRYETHKREVLVVKKIF